MSTFQIFPNFGRGGVGHRKSNFSQIQNSPHYPRGGGSRKLWTFSTICDISFLDCSPKTTKAVEILHNTKRKVCDESHKDVTKPSRWQS